MNTTPRSRIVIAAVAAVVALGAGAAAVAAGGDDTPEPAIPVEPDGGIGDTPGGDFPVDEARDRAQDLIGVAEEELTDDVRVARRGDVHFALTEDYVFGRITVELDDDGTGFRVVSVTLELPDGPETYS